MTKVLATLLLTLAMFATGCINEVAGDDMERDTQFGKSRRTTWGLAGKLTTNDPNSSFSVQTGDLSDLDYKYYTIAFATQGPANGHGYQALATITYVVNGVPITRQVTVGQGLEISGPADSITVRVTDATPTAWSNPGQSYSVTVLIVPGTRSSTSRPVLADTGGNFSVGTGTYQSVAPPETITVAVPQNTGVDGFYLTVATGNAPSGFVTVKQTSSAGTAAWEGNLGETEGPTWFALLPGMTSINVFVPGADVSAVFTVAWTVPG